MPGLDAAMARCAAIVRREARNFYYGLRLTPEPRRSALYAVYSWMRSADDLVDDPTAPIATREARLEAFRAATELLLGASRTGALAEAVRKVSAMPEIKGVEPEIWTAIAHVLGTYPIDPVDVTGLLDGLEADLETDSAVFSGRGGDSPMPAFTTRAELVGYCDAVASTVGRVCVAVWGLRAGASMEEARVLATQRGLAFQLTNILRDFAADYDDHRVYLAEEDFERLSVSAAEVRAWSPADRAEALVMDYVAMAREAYAASRGLGGMISADCVPTLWTMTRIYESLLDRLAAHPSWAAGRTPVSLPTWKKATIALRAMVSPRALLL